MSNSIAETLAPIVRATVNRFGAASAVVEFPIPVTLAMHGYALDLAREAIATALMRVDGARQSERGDYIAGLTLTMTDRDGHPAVNGNRVIVRAL